MKKNNATIERRYEFNVTSHRSIIEKRIDDIVNNENNNDDQKAYKLNSRKRKNKTKNNLRKQFIYSLKKKIVKMNIRIKINIVVESIVEFDIKIIFKRRKIFKKDNAKIITRYNDNANSIDLKLFIDLIHHAIDRSIIEFSRNYYFKLKSLFKLKFLIFDRINQINQIEFDQKYKYSIKKSLSTLDIIIKKSKRNRSLRRYSFTFTFINHKRKLEIKHIINND